MSKAWPVRKLRRDGSLAANARKVLRVRLAEFDSHGAAVDQPGDPEALHDLRIAAKRLRYTLEVFRPEFGDAGVAGLAGVKEIQERLGVLHDRDVRIALVESELAAQDLDELARSGLERMLVAERAGRESAYEAFRAGWEEAGRSGLRAGLGALARKPGKENR
ncbi:MAG: CHAD domain-containing protein [Chloroflexota bacterium]